MPAPWTERRFDDLQFHVRMRLGVRGGSRKDMTRLGPLFDRLYDWAIELFRADPNFDRRYLQE